MVRILLKQEVWVRSKSSSTIVSITARNRHLLITITTNIVTVESIWLDKKWMLLMLLNARWEPSIFLVYFLKLSCFLASRWLMHHYANVRGWCQLTLRACFLLEENKVCHAPRIDFCPQAKTVDLVSQYAFLQGREGYLGVWCGPVSSVSFE